MFSLLYGPNSHIHTWLLEISKWGVLKELDPGLKSFSWEFSFQFSSFQSLSCVWLFVTPWTAACQTSLFTTNSRSLLKLMSIESVMSSNHLILCHPLLLLPSIFPRIRVFSNESVLPIRWPKYWSFSFNISSSNKHSGLISFRMDWLDLLAVQGTLKSLLQHHSSKASILQHSAFFMVQLSHSYMTSGKTIALTRQTFVGKIISLLFNMPSRLVITFLPRSKYLLIWWLQSPYTVILESNKRKSVTASTVSPFIALKWWDQMPWSSFSECWALSRRAFLSGKNFLGKWFKIRGFLIWHPFFTICVCVCVCVRARAHVCVFSFIHKWESNLVKTLSMSSAL